MTSFDDPRVNYKFVALIECYPWIYDTTHPDYATAEKVDAGWQSVVEELGIGGNFPAQVNSSQNAQVNHSFQLPYRSAKLAGGTSAVGSQSTSRRTPRTAQSRRTTWPVRYGSCFPS